MPALAFSLARVSLGCMCRAIPVRASGQCGQACTDLNSVCYNSVTEHGQMFCVAVPAGGFGRFSLLSIYCPFDP
jgi:hypothetical protein